MGSIGRLAQATSFFMISPCVIRSPQLAVTSVAVDRSGKSPGEGGNRIAGQRKGDLLAGMNDAQVHSFSRIGEDYGETTVGIADGQVTQARSITPTGDAHGIPLQMAGKVAQGVALATL